MTIEKLIEMYGANRVINAIVVDELSWEEIKDLEYLEDRIITHMDYKRSFYIHRGYFRRPQSHQH